MGGVAIPKDRIYDQSMLHIVGISTLAVAIMMQSCNMPSGLSTSAKSEHTTLIYMIADNNLNYYAWQDLEEIEKGWDPESGKVFLYFDGSEASTPSHPVIWEINTPGDDGTRISRIVRVYPEQDSSAKDVMTSVLEYMISLEHSTQYSLVLWFHGSAWLPPDKSSYLADKGELESKSFGKDGESELALSDLVGALPDGFFSISFDACYMGSVEVAWALRSKAQYLLFSPTEILPNGFPYEKLLPQIQVGTEDGLVNAAQYYFDHYNDESNSEVYRSASISLVKTARLAALAEAAMEMNSNDWHNTLDTSSIQQVDRSSDGILRDFRDVYTAAKDAELIDAKKYEQIIQAYTNAVLAFHATELSCYLPGTYTDLDEDYDKLEWNRKINPVSE